MLKVLARLRVPLGFAFAIAAFYLAAPTQTSMCLGFAIAAVGEALRIWAAGHIEKSREVTRSGPYRFVRHPLYLGSSIMALGFVVAARNWWCAVIVAAYMGLTLTAAIRTEEATLDAKFKGEYSAYKTGAAPPVERAFSFARVRANREYRAVIGLAIGMAVLYLLR
ncbi:MAG TPA: isoprenylcysteine carboxylmethyltransferase family protein [Vicinamibacterales bacterium]|nr:isoprenylcysteine carboxylmethyltransferase family protein [Vicinamibacterales bacterium]